MGHNRSEGMTIRGILNAYLEKLEGEQRTLERQAATLQNVGNGDESTIRLVALFKRIDALGEKHIDIELLFAQLPLPQQASDTPSSWHEYLSSIENPEARRKAGEEIEIMRLSGIEARRKLAISHQYVDGSWDQPLLTAEPVSEDET